MEKTAMQKHLEWLKARMVITPEMEKQLLNEEKQQQHVVILLEPFDNFYLRLKNFVSKVEVRDMASEEEKEMILNVCNEQLKQY